MKKTKKHKSKKSDKRFAAHIGDLWQAIIDLESCVADLEKELFPYEYEL